MAAGLAHEIRNPLGAIKGAAQLLITADGKPAAPAAETAEFLDIIVEEANRLNNVVTRFLDYARSERPGREGADKVDLNHVVRKTVQLLQQDAAARTIELRVRIDEQLPQIAGDPESLLQVFLNLGQNALQAMPDGGTLEILTTRRRRSRLGYGQFAEVRFRDTGIGIPRDRLKKLFIPFYTTKQKGTGLGLAISHRIINQHGGTIEVRSTIGQGSTFSVFLPAAEPVPAQQGRGHHRDRPAHASAKPRRRTPSRRRRVAADPTDAGAADRCRVARDATGEDPRRRRRAEPASRARRAAAPRRPRGRAGRERRSRRSSGSPTSTS